MSGSVEAAQTVYSNTFEDNGETIASGVNVTWNNNAITTTPGTGSHPPDKFRGEINNGALILSLTNLPAHNKVTVQFDLFLLRSWDGNFDLDERGPDVFQIRYDSSNLLLYTTFRNPQRGIFYPEYGQSFPDTYTPSNLIQNDPRTGAAENDTLGYFNQFEPFVQDSVYRLNYTFSHSGNLSLQLIASGLQEIANESWGIDDIQVSIEEGGSTEPTATRTLYVVPTFTPTKTSTPRPPTFTPTPSNTSTPVNTPIPNEITPQDLFQFSTLWMGISEERMTPEGLVEILKAARKSR